MHRTPRAFALVLIVLAVFLLGTSRCSDVAPGTEPAALSWFGGVLEKLRELSARVSKVEECTCCCAGELAPVCSTRGVTYVNACEARCAGARVITRGPCAEDLCGGPAGIQCEDGAFCEVPPGCGDPFAVGHCEDRPQGCTEEFDPVCGCDGRTYGNDCERRAAGVPLAHRGACEEPPEACKVNGDCDAHDYCRTPDGLCAEEGRCMSRPQVCTKELAPVCGCDGRTYPNACIAMLAGVSIERKGACEPARCDGDQDCRDGEFCELLACGLIDVSPGGACVPKPEVCPEIFAPVCGCDGVTYANDCFRRGAGVSKASDGECGGTPLDCRENDQCNGGDYCARESGACDSVGECRDRPEACPLVFLPVCGCDGQTYGNDCEAAQAGTNVEHFGPCSFCGGIAGIPCPSANQFCQFQPGTCQISDNAGSCVEVPEACTLQFDPVCGCNGVTYGNACQAQMARAQIDREGPCKPLR